MDIFDLTPKKDTVVVELTDPRDDSPLTHNKKKMWIERYLPHTDEYKKVQYAKSKKYINLARKNNDLEPEIDLYEAEKDQIEVFAETTVNWQIYYGGEWIEFSTEKAKEIYSKASWITAQLQEGETSAEVFTKS